MCCDYSGAAGAAQPEVVLQASGPASTAGSEAFSLTDADPAAQAGPDCAATLAEHRGRPAGEGLRGGTNIIRPSNRSEEEEEEKKKEGTGAGGPLEGAGSWQGGFDWLEFTLEACWNDRESWESVRGRLELAKEAARAQGQGGAGVGPLEPFFESGGVQFHVMPTGFKGVFGGNWQWRVQCKGMQIGISDDPECLGGPNVKVVLSSYVLMLHGFRGALDQLRLALRGLGCDADVSTGKLSRVDFCVDCVGIPTADLVQLWVDGCYVSRPRKGTPHRDGVPWEGLTVGRGDLVRIYDKVKESAADPDKRALLVRDRWGGVVPDHATRVEYQVRREMLRELGVTSIGDLVQKQAEIVDYLTGQWFRLTERVPDRGNGNQARAALHWTWEAIAWAFSVVFDADFVEPAKRTRAPVSRDVNQRLDQAIGNFLSVAAIKFEFGRFVPRVEMEKALRRVSEMMMDRAFRSARSGKVRSAFEERVLRFDTSGRGPVQVIAGYDLQLELSLCPTGGES